MVRTISEDWNANLYTENLKSGQILNWSPDAPKKWWMYTFEIWTFKLNQTNDPTPVRTNIVKIINFEIICIQVCLGTVCVCERRAQTPIWVNQNN